MDYKETVNNVMALLKEKGVCTSSQKSHETCYKSLGDFMAERKETYSPELRSSWLESLQPMHTRQRWAANGWCSAYCSMLLDSRIYPYVGRICTFSTEHKAMIENVAPMSLEFPAAEFRESIEPFTEALEKHGYVGTTLKLARHALTALDLFLEIHSLGFHPDIMWAWFYEVKGNIGTSWLHWRRILRTYEDYAAYGDIVTAGKYLYKDDPLSLLPAWCREAIDGFLKQKQREFRRSGTIRSYRYPCIRFCRYLLDAGHQSFKVLTPAQIKAFARQDRHSTFKGKATYFVVVREFLQYMCENGFTDAPNLDRCLMTDSAPEETIVDVLTDEQLGRIKEFRKDHSEAIDLRDNAIVLLGTRMGFRASDVLNLKLSDIDWRNREISIVMAKTEAQIRLPMPVDVGNAIYAYITAGRPKSNSDYVFLRTKAPYSKLSSKVCTNALYRILPERRYVTGGGFHVTRRTFATNLLRNKAGIDEVMDALGHSDPTSVMKYLLLDDERSRKCGLSLKDAGISLNGGLA